MLLENSNCNEIYEIPVYIKFSIIYISSIVLITVYYINIFRRAQSPVKHKDQALRDRRLSSFLDTHAAKPGTLLVYVLEMHCSNTEYHNNI